MELKEDHSPSYEDNNNDHDDDDIPQLSATTMAALQEFYAEKLQQLNTNDNESQNFKENWQLSQFWYDDRTAEYLAKEAFAASGENGKICCLSSPTAFRKMKKLKPSGSILKLLEFDRRFESFGEDFLFYDYNDPLNLPAEWEHYFDVVVADPPFLSEECLTKTSQSIKYLTKNKIILCVGAVMEEYAMKLLQVTPTNFEVKHENNLRNRLMCYTNYKPHILENLDPNSEFQKS